jgi:hypothetical protein
MKRLRLIFRGGAVVEIDAAAEWDLEATDLMHFPPPATRWTDRLRYLSPSDVVAIIEVRPPVEA